MTLQQKVSFPTGDLKQKFDQLRDAYFKRNDIKETGDARLYSKAIILSVAFMAVYVSMNVVTIVWLKLILGGLLGLVIAGIGFNIMHDGSHKSFSSRPWVNTLMARTADVIGGSKILWFFQHIIKHHTYTNIHKHDDDIKIAIIRTDITSPRRWIFRYQAFYALFIYFITSLATFVNDIIRLCKGYIGNTKIPKLGLLEWVWYIFGKVAYICIYLVIPIYFGGWIGFWGFLIMHAVLGFTLAIVFQLAHVVEKTEFLSPDPSQEKFVTEDEWIAHELKTTANFAPKNKLLSWFVGGLNFQIEHHLFPRVSHVHYAALAPLVQQLATECGLPYNVYPTFSSAVASHLRYLKKIGRA